jgi:hypothetical protein
MRNAVIGVILGGAAAWTTLHYFNLMPAPPWRNWLPRSIANNDLFLILLLFGALMIGLIWDRYRKSS